MAYDINLKMNFGSVREDDEFEQLRINLSEDIGIDITRGQTAEWIVRQWFKGGPNND